MPNAQMMTDVEKVDTAYQSCLLKQAGDKEGRVCITSRKNLTERTDASR